MVETADLEHELDAVEGGAEEERREDEGHGARDHDTGDAAG